MRLQTILRFTEKERPDAPPFTPNRSTDLARAALRGQPSGIPLEVETRAYVTKAERRIIRGPHRLSDARVTAREKRAHREEMWRQARNLHVGRQRLTWREIASRLDPEGFANDPKAAMARIQMGALKVSMVRDLTELARAAVRTRDDRSPAKKNSAS